MSYIFETVTGNASALAFNFNGQISIKNYDVEIVNGNRLKVVSTQNEMFSLLEADVSEVEINGTVYSDPLAAQFALKALVSSTNEPVVMTKEMYLQLAAAVQAVDRGKILPDTPVPSGGWLQGWYTPGLFENADPGTTYPNQNNLKAKKGFITKFLFNGTVWDSVAYEMPPATNSIIRFSDSTFPLVAPATPTASNPPIQRTHNNSIWQLADGQTANVGDVPSEESSIWVSIGGKDKNVQNVLDYFIKPKTFTNQNETLVSEENTADKFRTFEIDNSSFNIENIYVSGRSSYDNQYLVGQKKSDNTTVVIIGYNDAFILNGAIQNVDFSLYKKLWIKFYTGDIQPSVSSQRFQIQPSVKNSVKNYIDIIYKFLKPFESGKDLIKLPINPQLGHINTSGVKLPYTDVFYIQVPVLKDYKFMYISGAGPQGDPALIPAVLITKKSGESYKLIKSFGEAYNEKIEIPENVDKIYVNFWPTFYPKVILAKEGNSEFSIFDYIQTIEAKKPLANEIINLKKPTSLIKVHLNGTMPTDNTATRTPTNMVMIIEDENGKEILKTDVTNSIQGNATAGEIKTNYNVKLLNDVGKKLKLHFPNWFPDSSIHFKGYPMDWSLTRSISGGRLLKRIFDSRPFPKSYVAPFPTYKPTDYANKENFFNDANFFIDGFPVEIINNGVNMGLFIFQQRREPENFHFNDADPKQIFLTNNNGFQTMDWINGFKPNMWEVRSPKMTGYVEGGAVTIPETLASIDRFFEWVKGVYAGTINFSSTYADYIDADNWIDVFIFCEIVRNEDFFGNNLNFGIWNDKVKMFCTDLDLTARGSTTGFVGGSFIGWSALLPQTKLRYKELRQTGVITLNELFKIYNEIPSRIGEKGYQNNFNYWKSIHGNAISNPSIISMQYIMEFFTARLSWLDTQWGV